MEVCVFQVKGSHAYWKKGFSSGGSPLTFSFPPRTAIVGLIGAILGIDRENLANEFQIRETNTAVVPLSPLLKDHLPQNWRQGPSMIDGNRVNPAKFNESFQANIEIVRNPHFAIVFAHKNAKLMREFVERLQEKKWFYPPYLGSLGFLADVNFDHIDQASENNAAEISLDSVLPLTENQVKSVGLQQDNLCIREEGVPFDVLKGRAFRYIAYVYAEKTGGSLKIIAKDKTHPLRYFHLKKADKNVVFFESCAN
ncbi:MAG TPA: type I-B CRISPR-associated protein Cas5b [Candidatus Acidoferrum sp.]|nr:type I-B CRISPR-associated protein Cas5b [Candidatus Acidoferrum sp.]